MTDYSTAVIDTANPITSGLVRAVGGNRLQDIVSGATLSTVGTVNNTVNGFTFGANSAIVLPDTPLGEFTVFAWAFCPGSTSALISRTSGAADDWRQNYDLRLIDGTKARGILREEGTNSYPQVNADLNFAVVGQLSTFAYSFKASPGICKLYVNGNVQTPRGDVSPPFTSNSTGVLTLIGATDGSEYAIPYNGNGIQLVLIWDRALSDAEVADLSADPDQVFDLTPGTAPTLTTPTASATSPTTSIGSVSTDQADGTLYWLTNTSSTATATAVKAGSSQSVTASGTQTTASTGLTENTTYYTHFLHRNAGGLDSAVVTSPSFTTPTNIFASDDYNDMISGQLLTGRTLNNALGGTGARTYSLGGSLSLFANSIPRVTGPTDDSWNSVALGQQDFRATYTFDPILATSAIQLTGRKGAASGNTTYYGVRLAQGHTTLAIYRGTGSDAGPPSGTVVQSINFTKPGTPIKLQAEFEGEVVTARVLRASDGAQLAEVSHTFSDGLTGNFLSFGFAGGGQTGYFDDLILESLSDVTPAPPDMNGSITVGTKTSGSISISYPAASDNVAVTGYEVSTNGSTWSDNGTSLSYTFLGLSALTSYTLYVRAYDAAGNRAATPLTVTTSTYRAGDTAANIIANTGPVGGNPAGFLYAFASTVSSTDWLSYTILSGPTPAGGTLTANPDGTFTYVGPDAATMVIQPEVNGSNAAETITVTLYDQSPDTELPVLTGSITVTNLTSTSYDLSWPTGTDNTGIAGYEYSLNGGTSWTDNGNVTTKAITGRTPESTDQVRVRAYDAAGNKSTPPLATSVTLLAGPDVTAPTLSDPTAYASGPTTASGTVTTNEATGTLYYLRNNSATATDVAVKAGLSQAVTASGIQTVNVTGLTASTPGNYIHYLHRDAAGNDSLVSSSAAFTTPAAPPPGMKVIGAQPTKLIARPITRPIAIRQTD